ncbi:hypothetical protein ACFTZF_50840 [Streptomyces mirabilis]|uniref:hypothetical protein n=1 Tax=Streptomyces mirabilis TaxID=68239 RepID=UPI003625323C
MASLRRAGASGQNIDSSRLGCTTRSSSNGPRIRQRIWNGAPSSSGACSPWTSDSRSVSARAPGRRRPTSSALAALSSSRTWRR